jgi:hypothetical protein
MSPTLDEDLRAGLRAYTADVTAAPDLAATVARSAGGRRSGRRIALVAAPVAVVAVVAAAVLVAYASRPAPQPAATSLTAAERALLAGPTRGDLAGNHAYLAAVVAAWERSHRSSQNADRGIFDHLLGRPTVVWAGSTPVGRAAYVVQAADLRNHGNVQLDHEGPAVLWGFVGPDRQGNPTVVSDGYPVPGSPDEDAAFLGADRSVLLVVGRETPVEVSWGATYTADGDADRNWRPVTFTDGVAVLTRPAAVRPQAASLRIGPDHGVSWPGNPEDPPADGVYRQPDNRLQWASADGRRPVFGVGDRPAAAWPGGRLPDAGLAEVGLDGATITRLDDVTSTSGSLGYSLWFAAGRTPDGRRLLAGEISIDDDPARVYAVVGLGPNAVVSAAPVRTGAAVPVLLSLPDGQGELVAAKGKTFTWTEHGTTRTASNAALVPAGSSDLRADGVPVS